MRRCREQSPAAVESPQFEPVCFAIEQVGQLVRGRAGCRSRTWRRMSGGVGSSTRGWSRRRGGPAGRSLSRPLGVTRCRMRSFSSAAAFSVKVNATIDSAGSPSSRSDATRWETTSVLPEPAAAMICTCPPRCATAAAASPSRTGILSEASVDIGSRLCAWTVGFSGNGRVPPVAFLCRRAKVGAHDGRAGQVSTWRRRTWPLKTGPPWPPVPGGPCRRRAGCCQARRVAGSADRAGPGRTGALRAPVGWETGRDSLSSVTGAWIADPGPGGLDPTSTPQATSSSRATTSRS